MKKEFDLGFQFQGQRQRKMPELIILTDLNSYQIIIGALHEFISRHCQSKMNEKAKIKKDDVVSFDNDN